MENYKTFFILLVVSVLLVTGVSTLECFACSGSMPAENCNIATCEESNECYVMFPNKNQDTAIRGCLPQTPDFFTECESEELCVFERCSKERCNSGTRLLTSVLLVFLCALVPAL